MRCDSQTMIPVMTVMAELGRSPSRFINVITAIPVRESSEDCA